MTDRNISTEERVTHFGPVYGRPVNASMRLCDATPLKPGESHSMSRSLKHVTCSRCEEAIDELVQASVKESVT